MRGQTFRRNMRSLAAAFVLLALCFYGSGFSAFAANEKIISSTTDGKNLYLYVKGVSGITGGSVQIGSAACPNVSAGALDALSPPMRTVILIDNSLSVKEGSREDIRTILNAIVDGRMEGEEFRIGTFSDSVTWLCNYSTDYDAVHTLLDTVEYLNQNTYFGDCLYGVVKDMSKTQDAVYSRIIIASDGADNQTIGYTNSEVTTLLERSNIPVYTIGTKGDNGALETMFSFSRASKADHWLLDGSISNEEIIAGLSEDHNLTCLRVTPDAAMLDGSQKNVQAVLQTAEGEVTVTASVNMPFGDNSQQPAATPEPQEATPEPTAEPAVTEAPQQNNLPVLGGSTAAPKEEEPKGMFGSMNKTMLIGIVAGALVIAVVAVVLIVVLGKKKAAQNAAAQESAAAQSAIQSAQNVQTAGTVAASGAADSDRTMIAGAGNMTGGDVTVSLWDQMQGAQQTTYLILRDNARPSSMFKVPIRDSVRIGRKDADIVIDYDRYISSRQCEIIRRGALLYIKDLGSANGTFYENVRVYDQETPIVSGGTIQIGQSKFTITIVTE